MLKLLRLLREGDRTFARIEKIDPCEPDMGISLVPAGDMEAGSGSGRKNRQRLYGTLGIDPARVHVLRQVHSKRIMISGPETAEDALTKRPGEEGDGLLNGDREHILAITVADCMPVYIFHRASGRFALLHSGWKGTGIAGEAVKILGDSFGLPARELTAVLGPSIRSCCYRVDEARAEIFERTWGSDSVVWRKADGGAFLPHLDLVSANVRLLWEAGVEDIRLVDECTACGGGMDGRYSGREPGDGSVDLGSFRREGPRSFTRMLAMIGFFN
jgi:hypothetical protein